MKIIKLTKIAVAETFLQRAVGLIGKKSFGNSKGLLIKDTNSIHTFFVFLPIDLVFLDKDMRILRLISTLKPFSFSPIVWKAKHVLELPVGTNEKENLKVGDKIHLV